MIRIVGDSFCDIIASSMSSLPKVGGDVLANISLVAGGSGLNSAVHGANYCSIMGLPIEFELVTAVGEDFQGKVCLEAMQHELIHPVLANNHGYSTGSCIVLSGMSERSFVTDRGCVNEMSLEWYGEEVQSFDGISHVHAAGYFNCQKLMTELPNYFREAMEKGVTTSLNPQYDATECWSGIEKISPFLTLFICNELELLACANPKDPAGEEPPLEIVDSLMLAAARVLEWGCKCVVATRGAEGASIFIRDESQSTGILDISEPAVYLKNGVIDSTGAGDSFCGAFLAEWIHSGHNNVSSIRSGLLAGAACVSIDGGSTKPGSDILQDLASAVPER